MRKGEEERDRKGGGRGERREGGERDGEREREHSCDGGSYLPPLLSSGYPV